MEAILFDDKTLPIYCYHDDYRDVYNFRASINVKFEINNEQDISTDVIARHMIVELRRLANSIENYQLFHEFGSRF